MKIDYDKLNELLNTFGLSLINDGDTVIFSDIETNMPLKPYFFIAGEGRKYINDKNILLSGFTCHIVSDNAFFDLNIRIINDSYRVYEIAKTVETEPHVYEEMRLNAHYTRGFVFKTSKYKKEVKEDGTEYADAITISHATYSANEETDYRSGNIIIHDTHNNYYEMFFSKGKVLTSTNLETDSLIDDGMKIEKIEELVDQVPAFKEAMRILCPILASNYSSIQPMYQIQNGKAKN